MIEKLRQQAASFDNHLLRLNSQYMARATRIHPVRSKEAVHKMIDGFWLGPGCRSIVEIIVIFHLSANCH